MSLGALLGANQAPAATAPTGYPLPKNTQVIPYTPQGGYYNQMAQASAGPNYMAPQFKFSGVSGGNVPPSQPPNIGNTTLGSAMLLPPSMTQGGMIGSGSLGTVPGGSGQGGLMNSGGSNSLLNYTGPGQSNYLSPNFNTGTGSGSLGLGSLAGLLTGNPLAALAGGALGSNSNNGLPALNQLGPTFTGATPLTQNSNGSFNIPNGTLASSMGVTGLPAGAVSGAGGNFFMPGTGQEYIPNGKGGYDLVGSYTSNPGGGPQFSINRGRK